MKIFAFLLVLLSAEAYSQSETLDLLKNYSYKYSKTDWHLLESETVKKSYRKQYMLELNKLNMKTTLEIFTIDHASKNKNYPEQKSGEMTSHGELEKYYEARLEAIAGDTTLFVEKIKTKNYEDYKILLLVSGSTLTPEDVIYTVYARNVIHRFFIVGVTIEHIVCKSSDDAKKLMISHLKKIKVDDK
ncbi:MAG: hypothetical protein HRT71_04835 [Flavobacteriales bacterium]|nr:hypothetical protein [Flavobacteriales bacterium]